MMEQEETDNYDVCCMRPISECEDCSIADFLKCRPEPGDTLYFMGMFLSFVIPAFIGMLMGGYGWYIIGWLVLLMMASTAHNSLWDMGDAHNMQPLPILCPGRAHSELHCQARHPEDLEVQSQPDKQVREGADHSCICCGNSLPPNPAGAWQAVRYGIHHIVGFYDVPIYPAEVHMHEVR